MYSGETATGRAPPILRLPAGALGEQRLARMVARGERRAFEVVFERYHRELYRYCRAIVGEPDEAHDALQNTMAAALGQLPNAERRTSLRGWLYRVAHNEAVSILRRRPLPVDPSELTEGTTHGADAGFEERERVRQLVIDLRGLPERQRGALLMRELSGLSYAQIAVATQSSEAGARQLVYEAREALRELELGRDLACESARRVISERDGRKLRGRRLRAHLRDCASCRDFQAAIGRRRNDLAMAFPPLAPAAASGLLAWLLGGAGQSGASGTAAGAGMGSAATGGGVALGGVGLKAASIVSMIALGAGAVGISGGIKPPVGDRGDRAGVRPAPGAASAAGAATRPHAFGAVRASGGPQSPSAANRSRPLDRSGRRAGASPATPGHPSPASGQAQAPAPAASPPGTPAASSQGSPPAHAGSGGPPASSPASTNAASPPQSGAASAQAHASPPADRGITGATTVRESVHGNSAVAPAQGAGAAGAAGAAGKSPTNP